MFKNAILAAGLCAAACAHAGNPIVKDIFTADPRRWSTTVGSTSTYIFYHNGKLPTGGEYRRSVAVEELRYGPDGAILPVPQTAEGPTANPAPGCK